MDGAQIEASGREQVVAEQTTGAVEEQARIGSDLEPMERAQRLVGQETERGVEFGIAPLGIYDRRHVPPVMISELPDDAASVKAQIHDTLGGNSVHHHCPNFGRLLIRLTCHRQ